MDGLLHLGPGWAHLFYNRGWRLVAEGATLEMEFDALAAHYQGYAQRHMPAPTVTLSEARSTIERVFRVVRYSEDELGTIELWGLPFMKPVLHEQGLTYWDLSLFSGFLRTLFSTFAFLEDRDSADGQGDVARPAKRKGYNYQAEVAAFFAEQPWLELWETEKELKADKKQRELDVGFVERDVLWLVECKSYAAAVEVERGDHGRLRTRREKLDCYLERARTLRELLLEQRKGRNYEVPDGVARLEYVVCTPYPEWIPSLETKYWLSSDTPRICTPSELLSYLTETRGST